MFKNIFKSILSKLYRERLYTVINLLGLALSFCCFVVLFLYIRSEMTVDQHFSKHDRIYRLVSELDVGSQHTRHAKVGDLVGPLLAQDYEQFSNFVRINPSIEGADAILLTEDFSRSFSGGIYTADNSIFKIFEHTIIAGDPATALIAPRMLAISESMAKLYFGDADPIGKTIGINALDNKFTVKLVFADLPDNTSLQYDILISYRETPIAESAIDNYQDGIVQFRDYTYFLLPENYDVEEFSSIADDFYQRYVNAGAQQMFPGQEVNMQLQLQALDEIYFAEAFQEDLIKGSRFVVLALIAVAIFILGVASVNYMTLATARFTQRARESGIRRTLGSSTKALVCQFLAEGLVYALLSLLIGVSLSEILLSTALDEMYLGMDLSLFTGGSSLLWQVLLIAVVIGLISGAYPAYYFSSVRPIDIFRPIVHINKLGFSMRSVLVGLQLLVSLSVISSALLMYKQIEYLNNQPLGFNKQNKVDINVNLIRNSKAFRAVINELKAHPGVLNASMTDVLQGGQPYSQPFVMRDDDGEEISMLGFGYIVDENYLSTFSIPLLQGRNFEATTQNSSELATTPMLVNETLVKRMGWMDAIGQQILMPANENVGEVIGVIGDFNFESLHQEIKPFALDIFYDDYRWQRHFILDVEPSMIKEVLIYAELIMKKFSPEMPFQYSFLDQSLGRLYQREKQQMQLVMVGAAVCIFISLLGIFGMTSFTLDQAGKEIAIRRILGGTMVRIITIKFKSLFFLITGAALISSFMVFVELKIWLENFSYRAPVSPVIFLTAFVLVSLLVAFTLALQSLKHTRKRPVHTLRYE